MRTVFFERALKNERGDTWSLIDEAAEKRGVPREEVLCVFRISLPDEAEDLSCVVLGSNIWGAVLLKEAFDYVRQYCKPGSWTRNVCRITESCDCSPYVQWKKPQSKRLLDKGCRCHDFALALAYDCRGHEEILAAAGVQEYEAGEPDLIWNFFHDFLQTAKSGEHVMPPDIDSARFAELEDQNRKLAEDLAKGKAAFIASIPFQKGLQPIVELVLGMSDEEAVKKLKERYGWSDQRIGDFTGVKKVKKESAARRTSRIRKRSGGEKK